MLSGRIPLDLSFQKVSNRWSFPGLDLKLTVNELDLGGITAISPKITLAQGKVSGGGEITGSLLDPAFEGKLAFTHSAFQIQPISQIFSLKNAQIHADHRQITFENVNIFGDSGLATVTCAIELSRLLPKRLSGNSLTG